MKTNKLARFALICIILISCKKDKDNAINNAINSFFNYNGKDYYTVYGLFEERRMNSVNTYNLYFYSSDITYSYTDSVFSGTGELLKLTLTSSIFSNSFSDYSIDNLKVDNTIDITSCSIFLASNQLQIAFNKGSLNIKNINNKYYFEYEVILDDNSKISGIFNGPLLIDSKDQLKISKITL